MTSVSPTSGPTAGGTTITINGSGYVMGAAATVRVGGVLATGIALHQRDAAPRRDAGGDGGRARRSASRNPDGTVVSLAGGFTYTAPATTPTLTSVTPTSGPSTGGTTITLTGTNFVSGATVRVGGTAATTWRS